MVISNKKLKSFYKNNNKNLEVIMEGYCVKCKAKREIQNPTAGFNKRGSAVVFGTCPECGTKIYRIGRTELHEGMEAPAK